MVKRIQIDSFGGPEVMRLVESDLREPIGDEVRIRHEAIGVNFLDTYHRSGLYQIPLPSGIGMEAAGIVEAMGPDVTGLSIGDRVVYCSGPIGAYSEAHIVKSDRLLLIPQGVTVEAAAASLLKGLTVQYLIRQIYKVKSGDTVLFHAAAGGVGTIACQWLRHLGVTIIGTVSSDEKASLALEAGCNHIIRYDREDIAARVSQITGGERVPVVFDGVGKSTWIPSLDSLKKRGLMVSYGNASGPVSDVNLGILAAKGSLFVTRPTLFDYTDKRADLELAATDLFEVIASGAVKITVSAEYRLGDAVKAHTDLHARKTTGSIILKP